MSKIDVTFSRERAAAWPLLHGAAAGADHTLCGILITVDWDYDGDCGTDDVECKRCRKVLRALLAKEEGRVPK